MQFDTYSAAGSAELKRQPRWGSNPQSSALKSDLSLPRGHWAHITVFPTAKIPALNLSSKMFIWHIFQCLYP